MVRPTFMDLLEEAFRNAVLFGQEALTGGNIWILMLIVIILSVMIGSLVIARRNIRLGRGDRRGATRVALVYFVVRMLVWLFVEHHNGLPERELMLFFVSLSMSVLSAGLLWLLYVALEPFLRRRWPGWIISWSRLVAGHLRDPLIGRDLLIGAVIGSTIMLLSIFSTLTPRFIGQPTWLIVNPGSEVIGVNLFIFARLLSHLSAGLFLAFIAVFMLMLFVVILRRELLAMVALWLLVTALITLVSHSGVTLIPFTALSAFLALFALKRYGVLALSSAFFFSHLAIFYPITTDLTAWYATDFLIGLGICVAIAAFGFYTSLGGEKLWSGKLLEE